MHLFYDTSVLNAEEKEKFTNIVNGCLESLSEEMLKEAADDVAEAMAFEAIGHG